MNQTQPLPAPNTLNTRFAGASASITAHADIAATHAAALRSIDRVVAETAHPTDPQVAAAGSCCATGRFWRSQGQESPQAQASLTTAAPPGPCATTAP